MEYSKNIIEIKEAFFKNKPTRPYQNRMAPVQLGRMFPKCIRELPSPSCLQGQNQY